MRISACLPARSLRQGRRFALLPYGGLGRREIRGRCRNAVFRSPGAGGSGAAAASGRKTLGAELGRTVTGGLGECRTDAGERRLEDLGLVPGTLTSRVGRTAGSGLLDPGAGLAPVLADMLVSGAPDPCEQVKKIVLAEVGKGRRLGFTHDRQLCVTHSRWLGHAYHSPILTDSGAR